jgi:hypothetical protein
MISASVAFGAPWSTSLKILTVLSIAILASVCVAFAVLFPRHAAAGIPFLFAMFAVVASFCGSALFMVRGYEVEAGDLLIRRLLWTTRLPLEDLTAAWADPAAMRGSIRLFGNGGLFVFAGLFTNRKLGRYRAFATQPQHSVVLRFSHRTVVVTPDRPHDFLQTVSVHCPQARIGVSAA